ncbi:BLUF domain-containing protein [Sphingomonas colocasiae]|uniref:BLUF domain-containing protein n=1 Tax=Sphingomonas colocasiae TaxID=1848973 RepID=A0ABS7PSR2_9SPHN|nr:BLUF domain-containing protein [Sphingomonas colocasiae]MBY8823427.1 BLUF domain-containing protein [Sphingomonas colocasiae]
MALRSLLYVSDARVKVPDEEWRVTEIVDVSRVRNMKLDVTGALMFAYSHFAQVLEGEPGALDELMESISRDPRHTNVRVLEVEQISMRRFANWTMAYAGPATLVESRLGPLVRSPSASPNPFAAHDLIELLRSMAALER